MSDLLRLTLLELTETLRAKRASPVDLMRDVLGAIDRDNPTLNAVVAPRDRAVLLDEARASEARIAAGNARPLEGIPFGVKDLEDAAGLPTTHGSKPFKDFVPTADATEVARLKAAGGIVVGKTNAPEFGSTAITRNFVYGVTRSPWDPERTPGGSSGGSSSAIAAEMLPLATASDGGGSIRIPASFVGAFGLKTSFGRVPRGPLEYWEHGTTVAYGPLTKTVEDGAFFLDLVCGHDATDPMSLPHPGISYLDVVRRPLDRKLKIGFSPDLGYGIVQSDVAAVVEDGVRVLERLGHEIRPVKDGPPNLNGEWALLSAFEVAASVAHLRPQHDSDFNRGIVEVWKYVEHLTQPFWANLMKKRMGIAAFCARVFSEVDVLVTPTVPYDPPPAKGPFPVETEGRQQITASVATFTIPFNLSWNPAASVRAGLSKAGFPVGLQIVGPMHREDLIFQVARAFERERPAHPHWPLRGK